MVEQLFYGAYDKSLSSEQEISFLFCDYRWEKKTSERYDYLEGVYEKSDKEFYAGAEVFLMSFVQGMIIF